MRDMHCNVQRQQCDGQKQGQMVVSPRVIGTGMRGHDTDAMQKKRLNRKHMRAFKWQVAQLCISVAKVLHMLHHLQHRPHTTIK